MNVELSWDEAAYLLALLRDHPGVRTRDREIRGQLVYCMTRYDGNTSTRMSPDIRARVAHWQARRKEQRA
jgi:hypothetical protein